MIKLEKVYKTLGHRPILRGLDLEVKRGETLIIIGPSGTGKSVTLSHIIGLMRPDEGRVLVDGIDVGAQDKKGLEVLRTKIGMLFQGGALLNWMDIYDNVALPLREKTTLSEIDIRERVMNILEFLELKGAIHKMPSEISGGMVKRAGLARAVVCEPKIMLYDEPTSGLDPVMSRKIDSLVELLKQRYGMTSVMVTHDLVSAVNIGDKIAMLAEGKVVEYGTPQEFMQSTHPLVREFINAQFNTGKKVFHA